MEVVGESYIQGEMRIVPKKGGSQQNGRGVYIERRVWMDGGGEEGRGGVNITTISRKRDALGTWHRKQKDGGGGRSWLERRRDTSSPGRGRTERRRCDDGDDRGLVMAAAAAAAAAVAGGGRRRHEEASGCGGRWQTSAG